MLSLAVVLYRAEHQVISSQLVRCYEANQMKQDSSAAGQCATSQSRPRSCCVQGQVVGCKVAAEALTGPEETRRSDPGAIRPNLQPAVVRVWTTRQTGHRTRLLAYVRFQACSAAPGCHLSICLPLLSSGCIKTVIRAQQQGLGPGSCRVQPGTRCTRLHHVQQSRPQHEKKQFRARKAARPTARRQP